MDRRTFIFDSFAGVLFLSCPHFFVSCGKTERVRFGMVTDIHYARKPHETLHYGESLEKLKAAVDYFNTQNLDFVIELGDFKDCSDDSKETTCGYLDEIEAVMSSCKAPVYHCLGNHDMDRISKNEFLSHTSNPGEANGKTYYSFVKGGIRFIVLDAEFRPDGVPYDSGNYNWKESFIPQWEQEWLAKELSASKEPAVIFVHQMLDSYDKTIPEESFVVNAEEVRKILVDSGKVLACFQGHWHDGSYSNADGIHHYTQRAVLLGKLPENNSYGIVEIDKNLGIEVTGLADCLSAEWKAKLR